MVLKACKLLFHSLAVVTVDLTSSYPTGLWLCSKGVYVLVRYSKRAIWQTVISQSSSGDCRSDECIPTGLWLCSKGVYVLVRYSKRAIWQTVISQSSSGDCRSDECIPTGLWLCSKGVYVLVWYSKRANCYFTV